MSGGTAYVTAGVYQALGYRFEVEVDDRLDGILRGAFGWTFEGLRSGEGAGADHRYRLSAVEGDEGGRVRIERDGRVVREGALPAQALVALMTDVNTAAIGSRADRFTLHAGAVSAGGSGILLPAESGSGKSTLTAALVRAGCDYLSDEAASIDLAGAVIEPYAKPLSLSIESMEALEHPAGEYGRMELLPASALRKGAYGVAVSPALVVFPCFEPGARASLTPVSRGEALVEMITNSFNFVHHGREWLPGVRDVVAGCTCWRLVYGDAGEAAGLIMDKAR